MVTKRHGKRGIGNWSRMLGGTRGGINFALQVVVIWNVLFERTVGA